MTDATPVEMATAPALLQVTPQQWQIIQGILQHYVQGYTVWAFGSRVGGPCKPYSDLALVIVSEQPLPLSLVAAIAEAFSESDFPWKVDLIDWATTSELVLAPMTKQRHPSISTQASVIQLVRKISAIYHVKLPFNRYRGIAKKKTADLTYKR